MMMKKHIIFLSAFAMLLTACAARPEEPEISETISETAAVTSESETTAAVTESETTASETESETTASETEETAAETAEVRKISTDSFEYIMADAAGSKEDVPEQWLAAARECLKGNERYDYFISYDPNGENEQQLVGFEDYLNDNGKPEARFVSAYIGDFNGSGQDEAFIIFSTPFIYGEIGDSEGGNDFAVYVNETGEAQFACQGYDVYFEGELSYGDISHIHIAMGENNASNRHMIFSTAGGVVKDELSYNWTLAIDDENDRIIKDAQVLLDEYDVAKWDCEKNCYTTITVSAEEAWGTPGTEAPIITDEPDYELDPDFVLTDECFNDESYINKPMLAAQPKGSDANVYVMIADESKKWLYTPVNYDSEDYYETDYVIIEHNGIIDELQCKWQGRLGIPFEVYAGDFDGDGETELASVRYALGGTFCAVDELVIYKLTDGHYKPYVFDHRKLVEYSLYPQINNKKHTITFSVDGCDNTFEADTSQLFPDGVKGTDSSNIVGYTIEGDRITILDTVLCYSENSLPQDFVRIEMDIYFSDGDFSYGEPEFSLTEY
ncbi:MAG: hypothetical protein ACI4J0_03040 [Huintestinicola sp.]|uniref:hypothetical protein n=1 Tax=Huintestinicola sp. TaxID=2981661 RepID=UPI003F020BDB